MTEPSGEHEKFDENWRIAKEAHYLHWTKSEPANQVQLAFRQHWLTFQELMGENFTGRRSLEVGCGRGSLSAYFADAGWDSTLLDLSPTVIELAEKAFALNHLKASFDVGDCLELPYDEGSFDLVFSIGLLEHFEKIDTVIEEQVRVLASGGLFIGYVVPHIPNNVQKDYNWICDILKSVSAEMRAVQKTSIFRSDALSPPYIEVMKRIGLKNIGNAGTYPLPMISHSIEFPFTLLPDEAELTLVEQFNWMLDRSRVDNNGANPWLCPEGQGQAFLIWGNKP